MTASPPPPNTHTSVTRPAAAASIEAAVSAFKAEQREAYEALMDDERLLTKEIAA